MSAATWQIGADAIAVAARLRLQLAIAADIDVFGLWRAIVAILKTKRRTERKIAHRPGGKPGIEEGGFDDAVERGSGQTSRREARVDCVGQESVVLRHAPACARYRQSRAR